LSSIVNDLPNTRISFFQGRSRIASSRRSCTSGSATSMSCSDLVAPAYTSHPRSAPGSTLTSFCSVVADVSM